MGYRAEQCCSAASSPVPQLGSLASHLPAITESMGVVARFKKLLGQLESQEICE
jgi:hypothetical protein